METSRRNLRNALEQSPCDGKRLSQELESNYFARARTRQF